MSTIAPPEQRTITVPIKWQPATRARSGERRVSGYASVFDSPSEYMGFIETIAPGAFTRALSKPGADFWLLWAHDQNAVLARTSAGTLELKEDSRGLYVSAKLVDTSIGRDTHTLITTGHARSMSFGFYVEKDEWETRDGVEHRRVTDLSLIEVSVVPEPAYKATSIEGRSTATSIERFIGARPRIRDRSVYGEGSKHSWFRDTAIVEDARRRSQAMERPNRGTPSLATAGSALESNGSGGVKEAQARLNTIATRDLTSSGILGFATTDAPFAAGLFETSARARAVIAAQFKQAPLERGGMTVTIPRITSPGASAAIQATENSAVSETDPATGAATGAVKTLAGQVDISQQLFDQTPGGVLDAAIAQELGEAIGTGMDVAVVSALLAASGIVSVSYTDATPTLPEMLSKLMLLRSNVHVQSGEAPNLLLMHPLRHAWMDAVTDSQNRPEGLELRFAATVIDSPSIPFNLGAGTNQDVAIYAVTDDTVVFSRSPTLRIMVTPGSSSLTVRIQAFQYFATVVRQPAGVGILQGTGMIVPVL